MCSFNDDFDITIETAVNHLMLSMAHLGHNLGHRPCTTLCKWAWQFVGCKQLAPNQRVHDGDLDLDPDKHNLQAQRITNE